MSKIFKKENVMPVIVLGVICIVVAGIMGFVNSFTSKEIEKQRLEAANAGKIEVLPGLDVSTMEEIAVDESYPKEVKAISKFDIGYVVETEVKGNASGMLVLVGIENDGKITGVKVIKNGETPSFWASVEPEVTGIDGRYNGKTPETLEPQLISGATNSSNGVYSAVKASVDAFIIAGGGEVSLEPEDKYTPPVSQRADEDLLAVAAETVKNNTGFTAVDFDAKAYNAKYLARLFKENGSLGYVAYVVVISESYGSVESETLVHIGKDLKIKTAKKLTCNISPANPEYGYTPPPEAAVDAFYTRLQKSNLTSIDDVELMTNATNTSTNVVTSIKEALTVVEDLVKKEMPTSEEEVKALISEFIPDVAYTEVAVEDGNYLKKLYKLDGNAGYVAYVANFSEKYGNGRLETETLVHIDNSGKIKDLKKLTWTNSAKTGSYRPPYESFVNAFYERLKGKTLADVEALLALDTNNGILVSRATITSKDLLKTLAEAIRAVDAHVKAEMPTPEENILEEAVALVGAGAEFEDVTPDDKTYVRRIYREKSGKGYVAYVVVISENYGSVESETLIHIENNGKIKNVKKLLFKTSDALYGYVPPTAEEVDAFYARLPKNSSSTIDGVELVTNATNTSTNVVNSIKEALVKVSELIDGDMPTSEDEVKALAGELIGAEPDLTNVTPSGCKYLKRLYKDNTGHGYVAYVVVISESYGTVETETLLLIGNDGSIEKINKMVWKTSDALYGYIPPTEDAVNAFYDSLIGKDADYVKALTEKESNDGMLVTNATNTSKNLSRALYEALSEAAVVIRNDMPTSEDEIKALADELFGCDSGLTDVTPKDNTLIRKLYKADGGYVAYLVAISPWYKTVETETLVFINKDGRITHVEKMLWKPSDASENYQPPTEEAVDSFYKKLLGHNLADFKKCFMGENPLLVTNATQTTTRLVETIAAALTEVENQKNASPEVDGGSTAPAEPTNTARIIGIAAFSAMILAIAAYIAVPKIIGRRKNG